MSGMSRNAVREDDLIVETRVGPAERQMLSHVNVSLLERVRATRTCMQRVLADARRVGLFEVEVGGVVRLPRTGHVAKDLPIVTSASGVPARASTSFSGGELAWLEASGAAA